MVHVKGLRSKQNIQPRIMSLILFNHSKSNALRTKFQNLLEKTQKILNQVVLPVAYSWLDETGCLPPSALFIVCWRKIRTLRQAHSKPNKASLTRETDSKACQSIFPEN
jgi:hypothetical protein